MVRYSKRQIMCYNGPSWLTLRSVLRAAPPNLSMNSLNIDRCVLAASHTVRNAVLAAVGKMMWVVRRIYSAATVLVSKNMSFFSINRAVCARSVGSQNPRATMMAEFVGWPLITIRKLARFVGYCAISATAAWDSLIRSGVRKPCDIGNGGCDD